MNLHDLIARPSRHSMTGGSPAKRAVGASRAIPDNTDHHIEGDSVAGAVHTPQATRRETQTISIRTCATTAGVRDTWLTNINSSRDPEGRQSIGNHHRQRPPTQTAVPETYIEVEICNQIHKCLLDTWCDHSIIPRKLVPAATLEPAPVDVKTSKRQCHKHIGSHDQ